MSLADRLASASTRGQGLPCPIAVILRDLPGDDADALRAVLDVPTGAPGWLSAPAIREALAGEGYTLHVSAIGKHRRHSCRCFQGVPK